MCLDTISKRKPAKEGYFYKAFSAVDDNHVRGIAYGGLYKRGEWYVALGTLWNHMLDYTFGFHGYKTKDRQKIAREWSVDYSRVLPCQYRGGHTLGTQDGLEVIVAQEMRILLPGEKVPRKRKPRKRLSSRKG